MQTLLNRQLYPNRWIKKMPEYNWFAFDYFTDTNLPKK